MYKVVTKEEFNASIVKTSIDLAGAAVGGKILHCTDEFFAGAENMIQPHAPVWKPDLYTENGKWMDGWETRRHNSSYDWCIVKLGFTGAIRGFSLDTAYFTGNQAPEASVDACFVDSGVADSAVVGGEVQWKCVLPRVKLEPSTEHFFALESKTEQVTHVRLNIYPDGGIARFRVYGDVIPLWPENPDEIIDLAYAGYGARAIAWSDAHYNVPSQLLLPGRGVNMGDGWETKRSREPGHRDWAIIRLGSPGYLQEAEVDTCHYIGNFPESVMLEGCFCDEDLPPLDTQWYIILPRTKTGPHKQHRFKLQEESRIISHVRFTIIPDGGCKRLRIYGKRAPKAASIDSATPTARVAYSNGHGTSGSQTIFAEALSAEAFAPFGQVIQPHQQQKTNGVTAANQGTANKHHHVARVYNGRPESADANLCVYECKPQKMPFHVKLLERHPHSTQAFIPIESGRYLVVVALKGLGDEPDLSTLRAFVATDRQGISYNEGVWHHPIVALDRNANFACLVFEDGSAGDCVEVALDKGVTVEEP
ncbi:uncharacterized protein VTP21DRAFT_21 [Calcarisporiella thermophila]|uniref:uncharacterized protein n=1 Tax=Calcarisporiella thermophila TaxID=911321 RepID=UPI0037446C4B